MAARAAGVMALLALAATTAGCSRDAGAIPAPGWSVDDEPSLIIGAERARDGHRLDRVAGATRLADGRIAVAEAATAQLRVFATDGRLLHASGGRDGRFIELLGRMPGDTLLVLSTDGTIERLDPDGTVRERHAVPPTWVGGCRAPSSCSLQFLPDGNLVFRGDLPGTDAVCRAPPQSVRRTRTLLTRIDWRSGRVDTLGSFPGTEWNGRSRRAFGAELAIAASNGFIFVAGTASDSIEVLDPDGAGLDRWHLPLEPRTIAPAARRSPALLTMLRNRAAALRAWSFPGRYPRFARLLADRDGFVWVMRYPEARDPLRTARFQCTIAPDVPAGGADWIVLAPDGTVASEVHTPPGLFPLDVGDDYVLGVVSDSLGATIRLHSLDRAATLPPTEQQI